MNESHFFSTLAIDSLFYGISLFDERARFNIMWIFFLFASVELNSTQNRNNNINKNLYLSYGWVRYESVTIERKKKKSECVTGMTDLFRVL